MSLYERMHAKLGTAGLIVAVCALVLSLLGGAYAATSSKKGKSKSLTTAQVKKIAKQEAMKYANSNPGAPGANGTNGTPGEKGEKGDKGDPGDNGKSVTEAGATPAECAGVAGGVKYTLEGGSTTTVCDGKEGSPWTAGGTLPANATETGGWVIQDLAAATFSKVSTAISFAIPLATALPASKVQYNAPGYDGSAKSNPAQEHCPGTVAAPKAAAGYLCVYASVAENVNSFIAGLVIEKLDGTGEGASTTGALLSFLAESSGLFGTGTWAVTAP